MDESDTVFSSCLNRVVALDRRKKELLAQMVRPAFQDIRKNSVRYLKYGELLSHKDSIMKFGESLKALDSIAVKL